jgi:hypothetical protein
MTCVFMSSGEAACLRRQPELLVLEGYRHWLSGYVSGLIQPWECARKQYAELIGGNQARIALSSLAHWVRVLGLCREDGLTHFPNGCFHLCRDECLALALVASAQCGDEDTSLFAARAISSGDKSVLVLDATREYAAALVEAGQRLEYVPLHVIANIVFGNEFPTRPETVLH